VEATARYRQTAYLEMAVPVAVVVAAISPVLVALEAVVAAPTAVL
jgi:hypothetical protein